MKSLEIRAIVKRVLALQLAIMNRPQITFLYNK